jgi:hypothetical protein
MKQKFHATNRITASYERGPVKKPRFKLYEPLNLRATPELPNQDSTVGRV